MNKGRTDYTVEEIKRGIYKINEFNISNSYLILGNEKALLIDCGVGAGDIKSVVGSLTKMPVILAATHAHVDHVGAAWQFGKIYAHYKDIIVAPYQSAGFLRRKYLREHPSTEKFSLDCKNLPKQKPYLTLKPFADGHEFDLGGRVVKAYLTPGHTTGSVCFRLEDENFVFVGDTLIPCLNLKYSHTSSLSEWHDSVKGFLPLCNGCELYGGHGKSAINHDGIKWQLETAEKIIEKTAKNDTGKDKKIVTVRNEENPHLMIIYRTDKIL
ncbi:MAG: MBL fold metallo-hydrolase [Acutalibacteraceae bacterium]|nr:MBL fold metallo-hydrolase [Oscillospiraceae bacterium]